MSGPEFWEILKRPSYPQRIRSWRKKPNTELLFLHPADDLVSLLLSYTIPFLSREPMRLFGALASEVAGFPHDALPEQLTRFFAHLRDKLGRRVWVERTGGSLPHTEKILRLWPGARVVHNVRDCRETAISMLTGSFFRLYLELEKTPDLGEWDEEQVPPVEAMGGMLHRWIVDAERALAAFPRDQQMPLRYEDLMSRPEETLLQLVSFLLDRPPSDADRAWALAASPRATPAPLRFPSLPERAQRRLEAAVGPALRLLGYET